LTRYKVMAAHQIAIDPSGKRWFVRWDDGIIGEFDPAAVMTRSLP
jgi:hypothetical protein